MAEKYLLKGGHSINQKVFIGERRKYGENKEIRLILFWY